jgi:hypothetical protein
MKVINKLNPIVRWILFIPVLFLSWSILICISYLLLYFTIGIGEGSTSNFLITHFLYSYLSFFVASYLGYLVVPYYRVRVVLIFLTISLIFTLISIMNITNYGTFDGRPIWMPIFDCVGIVVSQIINIFIFLKGKNKVSNHIKSESFSK